MTCSPHNIHQHVDGDCVDEHVPGNIITTISILHVDKMVVMMFPNMFTTQFIFHVDGDGGDDVP